MFRKSVSSRETAGERAAHDGGRATSPSRVEPANGFRGRKGRGDSGGRIKGGAEGKQQIPIGNFDRFGQGRGEF